MKPDLIWLGLVAVLLASPHARCGEAAERQTDTGAQSMVVKQTQTPAATDAPGMAAEQEQAPAAADAQGDAAEQTQTPTPTDTQAEQTQAPATSTADYERRIRERAAEHGVYDPVSGEYLLALGLAHQAQGEHEQAIAALERALQIKRVNEGLQSVGQLLILKQLLKSNVATANWEMLDRNYQQLLWINKRNYEPDDPRLLPIIDEVGRWKLKAYKENLLDGGALRTIGESEKLFRETINILEGQYGEHNPDLIRSLYGRAMTNYQYAIEVANTPQDEFQGVGSPTRTQVICRTLPTPDGGSRRICNTISIPDPGYYASRAKNKEFTLEQRLLTVGKALQQIVDIHAAHPDLPDDSRARALVHLGDWNMLRGRKTTAFRHYESAYAALSQNGSYPGLMEELFGKPQDLPALRLPLPEVDKKLREQKTTAVLASFDVSSNGRARNVKIIESDPPDATSARRRARKTIRARVYRPRFEEGEPAETLDNRIRILY